MEYGREGGRPPDPLCSGVFTPKYYMFQKWRIKLLYIHRVLIFSFYSKQMH